MNPDKLNETQLAAIAAGDVHSPDGSYFVVRLHGRYSPHLREHSDEVPFFRQLGLDLMIELSPRLLHVFHDEILMVWYYPEGQVDSHLPFEGSHTCTASSVASIATYLSALAGRPTAFEAQVWSTALVDDVIDFFARIEGHARNHRVHMLALTHGGRHANKLKRSQEEVIKWLYEEHDFVFDDLSDEDQHGNYFYKHSMPLPMEEHELAAMPDKVRERLKGQVFERSVIVTPFEGLGRKKDAGSKALLKGLLTGMPVQFGKDRIVAQGVTRMKKKIIG